MESERSGYATMEDGVFQELHDLPMMLPGEEVRSSAAAIAAMAVSVGVAHVLILFALRRIEHARQRKRRSNGASGERKDERGRGHDRPTSDGLDDESLKRISYQLVHFLVNLILGLLGIRCYHALTSRQPPLTVEERISGLADDADVLFFGRAQIAYQLWSIPAEILMTSERSMLGHHVGVVVLASVSTFASNGFRYFTPFFYGVIETSSVPLSIMNTFKTNRRRGWTEMMPRLYGVTKLTFAATFLTVRVYLWLPHMVDFWYLAVRMFALCESTLCMVVFVSIISSSAFLTYLQLLWATKILRGLLTMAGLGLGSRAKKTLSKEE